jgi:hypothetical protein
MYSDVYFGFLKRVVLRVLMANRVRRFARCRAPLREYARPAAALSAELGDEQEGNDHKTTSIDPTEHTFLMDPRHSGGQFLVYNPDQNSVFAGAAS